MSIRREMQLLLIIGASLFSVSAFADKPAGTMAEKTQVATEHREKAEHKTRIEEHKALAEKKHAKEDCEGDEGTKDEQEKAGE